MCVIFCLHGYEHMSRDLERLYQEYIMEREY